MQDRAVGYIESKGRESDAAEDTTIRYTSTSDQLFYPLIVPNGMLHYWGQIDARETYEESPI